MNLPTWTQAGPQLPLRFVLALLSGIALALAFPPWGWWPAAPVGVALATAAWWRATWRTALVTSYVAGVVFHLMLLAWIRVLGWDAWVVLSLGWSIWWLVLGLGVAASTWWRWWPLAVPGIWLLSEALRSRMPWGGFPWGKLAFSQAESPWLAWAAIGGAPLVSWLAALSGCLVLWAWLQLRAGHRFGAIAGVGAAVVPAVIAALIPIPTAGQGNPSTAQMAVIQGGVPRTGLDFNAQRRAVLSNHVTQTQALADAVAAGDEPQPVAVIWPENASDVDPYVDTEAAAAISAAVDAIGVPVLVGAVVSATPETLWNIGVVWEPGKGPTEQYIKQHPVPFGEYLPGRQWLTAWISRFERIPKDFDRGDRPGILTVGPVLVGDVICFEIAYDGLVRQTVRAGARVIVVQTNNATYGGTSQPAQQIAMSQLRAVEHGRDVLVAATSGITAIIDPAGNIKAELPELSSGWLNDEIPLRDQLTVANRVQWAPEAALVLLGVVGWFQGARQRSTVSNRESDSPLRRLESAT